MEIYRSVAEIKEHRPAAIALGFFDGLHLGHTELISKCIIFARERGLSADVFTFKDNPKNVISGKLLVPRLMPESEKIERLSGLGIDRVFDFDFADNFHTMTPADFAYIMLSKAFSAKSVFCGFNFHFGADATGDSISLETFGKLCGFDTHVIDPVYVADRLVSSTLIRRCINSGDVEPAGRLLGREYSLKGLVEEGRNFGRILGFRTANFSPDKDMTVPSFGVYVTETVVDGIPYPSVSNVGICPTVKKDRIVSIENHILDQNMELYGKEITTVFKKMIRKERRFDGEEALKRQIAKDVAVTRSYFANNSALRS